jgi:hypothetical protein
MRKILPRDRAERIKALFGIIVPAWNERIKQEISV